ncbi:hypothetical protein K5X82_05100 [Halosquirtibacter xylanolyticus]|uniref:hypothetical protein n=1 Tax=Halosquirtibacter xylanolyticus TaxID=3374599 RepID=UPI003749079C|nr:hypothetical protein K5X82_05100 [Prolixibacteraceae bacterium]
MKKRTLSKLRYLVLLSLAGIISGCTDSTPDNDSSAQHFIDIQFQQNLKISTTYNGEELGPKGFKNKFYYNGGYYYYGTNYNELESKGKDCQLLKIDAETGKIVIMNQMSSWSTFYDLDFYQNSVIATFSGYSYIRILDSNTLSLVKVIKGKYVDVSGEEASLQDSRGVAIFEDKVFSIIPEEHRVLIFKTTDFTQPQEDGDLMVAQGQLGVKNSMYDPIDNKKSNLFCEPHKIEVMGNYLLIADKYKINVYDKNLTLVNTITKVYSSGKSLELPISPTSFDFGLTNENHAFMRLKDSGKHYLIFFDPKNITNGSSLPVFYCEEKSNSLIDPNKNISPSIFENQLIVNDNEGGVNIYDISEYRMTIKTQ